MDTIIGIMKKIVKGAKLFALLAAIILGTKYFIRKAGSLSQDIEISRYSDESTPVFRTMQRNIHQLDVPRWNIKL